MASAHFGRSCGSNAHCLTDSPDTECYSGEACLGRKNLDLLADYLEKTTDWATLWQGNPVGGWICREGRMQHPLQPACCCGDNRSDFLAGLLFKLSGSVTKADRCRGLTHPLDASHSIATMAVVFNMEVKEYIAERYCAYRTRQQTPGEAEGVDSALELHALEPLDYDHLINVLNTNAGICYPGCGCSSGPVSSELQEPQVNMDVEEQAETDGGESGDVPPQESNLDLEPAGEGLKLGGETLSAVPTGERVEGALAAAQGSLPVPGCSKDQVMSEVKTLVEGLRKEFRRGRGAIKRTITGEPNKPTAPRIYGKHRKSSQVPLSISAETIPRGTLPDWRSAYLSATPPVQRELLCISEAVRSVRVQKAEDRLAVVPIDFYESPKEILLERGNYLVQRT